MKILHPFYCFILILTQISLNFNSVSSVPDGALVTELPGFSGTFPSKHYAGYVTIGEKRLYYYFVESEGNPSKDPVVLWLNGGPGCSSFDGFIYEHGNESFSLPLSLFSVCVLIFSFSLDKISILMLSWSGKGPFNFEKDPHGGLPTLHLNPYSWSKVSSVIYLDSPAGVGYSYSTNTSDYITGDLQTASDSHKILLKWFELYPEFLANPFYISGESYAGIYVPMLTYNVVKGIEAGVEPILNLKGYLVGNGATDDVIDANAIVPFAHGMGLISDELFETVHAECNGNFYNSTNQNCENKLSKVNEAIAYINMYNILEPCYHAPRSISTLEHPTLPLSFRRLGETERPFPVRKRIFGHSWSFTAPLREGYVPSSPQLLKEEVPCYDEEVADVWLNDEAVRKALHADSDDLAGRWELCTDRISFFHDGGSMIEYHKSLTLAGYRALIYSGDHDMAVPFTGSQVWTRSLGYKTIDEWRPWYVKDQVAGYTQGYDHNLTFLTIKGCGHTVPEYKPVEALEFYLRFLAGAKI